MTSFVEFVKRSVPQLTVQNVMETFFVESALRSFMRNLVKLTEQKLFLNLKSHKATAVMYRTSHKKVYSETLNQN